MTLLCYEPGTSVVIGDNLPAIIQSVLLLENNVVHYNCAWWVKDVRHTATFLAEEVCLTEDTTTVTVGFHTTPPKKQKAIR
jgi:hypothetical protein